MQQGWKRELEGVGEVDGGNTTVHRAIPRCREGLMVGGREGGRERDRGRRGWVFEAEEKHTVCRSNLLRSISHHAAARASIAACTGRFRNLSKKKMSQ